MVRDMANISRSLKRKHMVRRNCCQDTHDVRKKVSIRCFQTLPELSPKLMFHKEDKVKIHIHYTHYIIPRSPKDRCVAGNGREQEVIELMQLPQGFKES